MAAHWARLVCVWFAQNYIIFRQPLAIISRKILKHDGILLYIASVFEERCKALRYSSVIIHWLMHKWWLSILIAWYNGAPRPREWVDLKWLGLGLMIKPKPKFNIFGNGVTESQLWLASDLTMLHLCRITPPKSKIVNCSSIIIFKYDRLLPCS